MHKPKIGILTSGKADIVAPILACLATDPNRLYDIGLILTTTDNYQLQALADQYNIPYYPLDTPEPDSFLVRCFLECQCSYILLLGYTQTVGYEVLHTYDQRVLCLQPSLIPAFTGLGYFYNEVIQQIKHRAVTISGCTLYITNEYIGAGEILGQFPVTLDADESIESLKTKIHNTAGELLTNVLSLFVDACGELDFANVSMPILESVAEPVIETVIEPVIEPDNLNNKANTIMHTNDDDYMSDYRKIYSGVWENSSAYAICDVGLKRKENMDTVLLTDDLALMGVADGVGSALAGKQSSRMIMHLLKQKWLNNKNYGDNNFDHGKWLEKAIIESNQDLIKWNNKQSPPYDLGSTLVIGAIDYHKEHIYISNTGDSRAYLWRNHRLYRLTTDHSDDDGALSQYIGGEKEDFGLDLYKLRLYREDKIIFCSDGLLYAGEQAIVDACKTHEALHELGEYLLNQVYKANAPDNTGIVIFRY